MEDNQQYTKKEIFKTVGLLTEFWVIKFVITMKIFNYIYYNLYKSSIKKNAVAEIPVITYISFCQTNNFLTLINIFYYYTDLNTNYYLPKYYLIIQIVLYIVNYWYFQKMEKGISILQNENYSLKKHKFLIDVYLFSSVLVMGLSYYIYKEY